MQVLELKKDSSTDYGSRYYHTLCCLLQYMLHAAVGKRQHFGAAHSFALFAWATDYALAYLRNGTRTLTMPGADDGDQLGPVTCQNVDEPPENVSGVNEFLLVWQPKWPLNYGELLQRLPVVKRALGDVADRGGERWVLALPL